MNLLASVGWGLAFLAGSSAVVLLLMWKAITRAPTSTASVVFIGVLLVNSSVVLRFLLSGVLPASWALHFIQWTINVTGLLAFSWLIRLAHTWGKSKRTWPHRTCFAVSLILIAVDSFLLFNVDQELLAVFDRMVFAATMVLILIYGLLVLNLKPVPGDSLELVEAKRLFREVALALMFFFPVFVTDLVLDSIFPALGLRWLSVGLWGMTANLQFFAFFYRWVFHSVTLSAAWATPSSGEWEKARLVTLSEREREIVLMSNQGLSNKEIAWELGIAVNTVRNHVFNIYKKAQVKSRVELLNLFR